MGADALRAARARAEGLDPFAAAGLCGVDYDGTRAAGVFAVPFLGQVVRLSFPEFEPVSGEAPLPPHVTALLVYYLALSDGSEPTARWRSFAEMPDGSFYVQAFRGYTAASILRHFSDDPARLESALSRLGAQTVPGLADRAWRIPALPRVPVVLLWWDGDDEFGPRADVLFDATAPNHLPTDGLAVLGSWMTATLTRPAG